MWEPFDFLVFWKKTTSTSISLAANYKTLGCSSSCPDNLENWKTLKQLIHFVFSFPNMINAIRLLPERWWIFEIICPRGLCSLLLSVCKADSDRYLDSGGIMAVGLVEASDNLYCHNILILDVYLFVYLCVVHISSLPPVVCGYLECYQINCIITAILPSCFGHIDKVCKSLLDICLILSVGAC